MPTTEPFHSVQSVSFESDQLIFKVDGQIYHCCLLSTFPALGNACSEERRLFEISPSGYGIYWPLLDLDLSVDGLIRVSTPVARSV